MLPALRRLELNVHAGRRPPALYHHRYVQSVLQKLSGHPQLTDLRLTGAGGAVYARLLHESGLRQQLRTLHVRCVAGDDLMLLADMPALRELRVSVADIRDDYAVYSPHDNVLRARDEDVELEFEWTHGERERHINELIRSLTLVNRVNVFQLQWVATLYSTTGNVELWGNSHRYAVPLRIELATMRRLAGWTELRYLGVLAQMKPVEVRQMRQALGAGLKRFDVPQLENPWPGHLDACMRIKVHGDGIVVDLESIEEIEKERVKKDGEADGKYSWEWKKL